MLHGYLPPLQVRRNVFLEQQVLVCFLQAAEVDAWVAEYQKFVTQHGNLGRELQTA